ncbi:hypothetical protein [Bauldia sp.]|uniref:hypothetical protein n=1 Tax=Bauldia sp. TaxID=2575872 RepID=UPI003BAD7A69
MKNLIVSLALVLGIPSVASAEDLEFDCQKGWGECKDTWYAVEGGPVYVTIKCSDGSKIYDQYVSSPNAKIICQFDKDDNSSVTYECNQGGQKVTYDIKAHLKCK